MSEFLVGDPGRTSCKGDKFGFPTFIAPGCPVHDLDMERRDINMSKEFWSDFTYCPKGRCNLPQGHKGHCSDWSN